MEAGGQGRALKSEQGGEAGIGDEVSKVKGWGVHTRVISSRAF